MQRLYKTTKTTEGDIIMEKQYSSVADMLNAVSDDKKFNEAVKKEIQTRRLAKTLFAMRCEAGLTQQELAAKLKCTQGKVSKIEHSLDMDISIGDLVRYTSALNMNMEIGFFDNRLTMVDKAKHHLCTLKSYINKMIEMSRGDAVMEQGAEKFAREALTNISWGLLECVFKAKTCSIICIGTGKFGRF
jgi:transcriptional regulator with XRE-family HTH domain